MKFKRVDSLIVIFALLISMLFPIPITAKAADLSRIYYTTDSNITVGQDFNIYVNADNLTDLYGQQINFSYDPTLIQVNDIQAGSFYNGKVEGVDYMLVKPATPKTGLASAAMLLLGNKYELGLTVPANSQLFVIKARALKAGTITLNTVTDNSPLSATGNNICVKLSDSNAGQIGGITYEDFGFNITAVPQRDSIIISNTIPTTMVPGETYNVNIVVKNTGSDTWTAAKGFKLAPVGLTDPFYNNRLTLSSTESILPEQTKTFTFTMKAPSTEGTFTSDWQMVQEGVAWFGSSLVKQIIVAKPVLLRDCIMVSNTIPTTMIPGETYNVSIVVKNTGSDTWTAAKGFKLAPVGLSDPFYNNRLTLSSTESILPEQSKTFTFTMKAPLTEGTFTSDWQMVQEGRAWFGSSLVKQIIVAKPVLLRNSIIVSNTIPTSMVPGETYNVNIVVKNTGSDTWTAAKGFKLAPVGLSDPFYNNRLTLSSTESILPEQSKTFTFTMKAPLTEGTFTSDWQMVQEGVAWFGSSLVKQIVVAKPVLLRDSIMVSNTIPTTMVPGETYNVNVIVKNTGSDTWTAAKGFKLAPVGLSDPFYTNRLTLSSTESILPGQSKTFVFAMKAPTTEGTFTSDWQMVQEGVAWFGSSLVKQIVVAKPALLRDSIIVSNTIPTTMVPGETYNVNVIVKNTGSDTWTAAKGFKLAPVGLSDPFYTNRLTLSSTESILPGQSKTFAFAMKAPITEGTFTSDWQMVQEGVAWFGPSLVKQIVVAKPALLRDSIIVSDTIPTTMIAGQTYNVNVIVKNTGSDTWTAAKGFKLAPVGLSDPFYTNRLTLSSTESILPGQSKTFAFAMKAPTTEGTFTSDWQMVQEGVAWFGSSLVKQIAVKK